MIYIGRNRVARNTGTPTTKDALVELKNMHCKCVRVTAKSCLVLNPEDDEPLDGPDGKKGLNQEGMFTKMAEEIAMASFKLHENLKITGMIYFNVATGEVLQVLSST